MTTKHTTTGEDTPAAPEGQAKPAAPAPRARGRRWAPEGWTEQVWRDVRATTWRLRRQWLPHALAGGVAWGGLAAEAVTAHTGASPAQVGVVVAGAAYPAAWWAARWVRARRRRWARRAHWAGMAAATWLTLAPFTGVGEGQVAALVACEYALAARWWQANRLPYPAGEGHSDPTAADVADVTDVAEVAGGGEVDPPGAARSVAEQVMAAWAANIARKNGPAPDSQLMLPEETPCGWAFTLQLAPAQQIYPDILNVLGRIASGLDVGVDALVLEQHPGHASPGWCRLQVITDSPITGDVDFTGPRRLGTWQGKSGYGLLELGPYADGSGEAVYRLYTPGSMWSGVVIGGTGIGKSRLVENIVISAVSGGDTEYVYLDPNRGGSSPALARHADWFATAEEAPAVLAALLEILDARADENAVEGWTGFTPSPGRPGLLVVIEECHRVFTAQSAELWARIAREGRKHGLAVLCVSQYSGLETFGGREALRSSVMEGNAIAMRVTSNSAKGLMAGLEVDPKTLPKIPGYAYTLATEEGGGRTAPFRNRNTTPGLDAAAPARWLAAQVRPGLDTLAATATLAAGTAYRDRHTSTDTGRAASAARVQALRGGHLPAAATTAAKQATPAPSAGGGEMGVVVKFPQPLTADDLRPTAQPQQADQAPPAGLSASHQAVYDAVAAGAGRPAEVQLATGLGPRRVADLLRDLVESGHLARTKPRSRHGHYRIA